MMDDRQLLAAYVRNHSEEAFTELVRRHTGLVYSAAIRQTRDAQLAKDVAQTVFANLAIKAMSIPQGTPLVGWLHRDTRFTALDLLRKESRRARREQEAAIMNRIESESSLECESIRPVLDEALHELGGKDRDALLLRFFDQRDLAGVGAGLGASADAARKRVDRALERLRAVLAKRGITTTAAALGTALSAHAMEPVPAGLALALAADAAAVIPAATSAGAWSWAIKFMSMSKPKLALALLGAAGVISTPVLLQEKAIARARTEQTELQARAVGIEGMPAVEPPLAAATNDQSQREELERLRKESLVLRARRDDLRARAQSIATSSPPKAPTNAPLASFSMKNVRDAGQNTPADLLQTWLWAALHGDTNRIMQLMAFEPGTDMETIGKVMEDLGKETAKIKEAANGPEAMMAKGADSEFRVLKEQPADNSNDRWITVEDSMNGRADLQRVLLRFTQTGWRIVIQTNGLPTSKRVDASETN